MRSPISSHVPTIAVVALLMSATIGFTAVSPAAPLQSSVVEQVEPQQSPPIRVLVPLALNNSGAQIVWSVPAGAIPASDQKPLEEAVAASTLARSLDPDSALTVTSASVAGGVAVLEAATGPLTDGVPPDSPTLLLALQVPGRWRVTSLADPDFCEVLRSVPDTLLDSASRSIFIGCNP